MTGLRIARGLSLPVDVAGEAIAILAKRGAGKTNTGRVLVEELHAAGVQLVVLDPVGAWWGLRSSADGKSEGLPMPVLGGAHGDVPLQSTAGALLADVVVDTGQSLILDLSDFSKTEQRRFVTDFAERLYTRKARDRTLLHLVLEEADEFAPQRVNAGDARMVGSIEQLVRRGRGRGIGLTMITQRSASLNKSVLTQSDVLIAMRTTGPQDRAAVAAWVEKQDVDGADDVVSSLASLATGEAWIWNPERELLERVQIRIARTFDSSSTPKAGQKRAEPKRVAAIDLTVLGAEIEATAERAKDNDPAELRKRVRELERQVANTPMLEKTIVEPAEPEIVEVHVPVVDQQLIERYIDALADTKQFGEQLKAAGGRLRELADEHRVALEHALKIANGPAPRVPRQAEAPATPPPAPSARPTIAAVPALRDVDARVTGPQQKILDALAWFESIGVPMPRRSPLGAVAGSSPKSSGFEKNLSTLRTNGLIDYPDRGRVTLTGAGRDVAQRPQTTGSVEDLHEAIYRMVSGPQAALLRALVAAYPAPLTRDELADAAGVSAASSGFEKNISTLKSFELVYYPERGYVQALPVLFLEDAA